MFTLLLFILQCLSNTLIWKLQNTFTILCIHFLDNFNYMVQPGIHLNRYQDFLHISYYLNNVTSSSNQQGDQTSHN